MTYKTISNSPEDTFALGAKIGRLLKGGEVIELTSDLGGGKTVLVRGLAKGLGFEGTVTSPTFTISRVYPAGSLELHHFDFYRLLAGDIVEQELNDVAGEPDTVTVVEWAGHLNQALPKLTLQVHLKPLSDTDREVEIIVKNPVGERLLKGFK